MPGAGFGILQRLGVNASNTSPMFPSTRASCRASSANWLSATVAIKRSPASALASSAATSIARFAPLEPSVATMICRMRCSIRSLVC